MLQINLQHPSGHLTFAKKNISMNVFYSKMKKKRLAYDQITIYNNLLEMKNFSSCQMCNDNKIQLVQLRPIQKHSKIDIHWILSSNKRNWLIFSFDEKEIRPKIMEIVDHCWPLLISFHMWWIDFTSQVCSLLSQTSSLTFPLHRYSSIIIICHTYVPIFFVIKQRTNT